MSEKIITAGIYARKSLFTGKGESIQNQVAMCTEFAKSKGWETMVYTDEGYSGSDTDRPAFREMLSDIERGRLNNVIFYRLDRISRRILDICEFIEQLNSKGVGFISITESFDTTSPIGRAMVHIAATFAQLEREMLAQRIKDNMMQLAKTGRWLGGITPTGFRSVKVSYTSEDMKKRHMHILEEIPGELDTVKQIYGKYTELRNLSSLESYCSENNIKTKNNNSFSKVTLRGILTNPVYITADSTAYDYFLKQGIQLANPLEDFDGTHGVITYNKNHEQKGKHNKLRKMNEWIMAVGNHKGIVSSSDWIFVQRLLKENKTSSRKYSVKNKDLLHGLLYCGVCSSPMYIKYGNKSRINDNRFRYYVCENKCGNSNARVDLVEELLFEKLNSIDFDKEFIKNSLSVLKSAITKRMRQGHDKNIAAIKGNEVKINNLIYQLEALKKDSSAALHIRKRIDELICESDRLKSLDEDSNTRVNEANDVERLIDSCAELSKVLLCVDDTLKRRYLLDIIETINWDNGTLSIRLKG